MNISRPLFLSLVTMLIITACRSPAPSEETPEPSMAGTELWLDAHSPASQDAENLRSSQPENARRLQFIADQPTAQWLGEWGSFQAAASMSGKLVTLVLYNIPYRDCGSYSAGGSQPGEYRAWVEEQVKRLASQPAWVIVEPDALAQIDCLSTEARIERMTPLREAVHLLKQAPAVRVYLDAGNPNWKPVDVMVERLMQAGIAEADGFALNVSNFHTVEANVSYGQALRARLPHKTFVVDTSRNGLGPDPQGIWCNPRSRALGRQPSLRTGIEGVDAWLWVKRPGQSDGTCNGGPRAGQWWREIALEMAKGAGI